MKLLEGKFRYGYTVRAMRFYQMFAKSESSLKPLLDDNLDIYLGKGHAILEKSVFRNFLKQSSDRPLFIQFNPDARVSAM